MTDSYKKLRELIAIGEGTSGENGYDVTYAYGKYNPSADKKLSEMTLSEVMAFQNKMVNNQRALELEALAAGKTYKNIISSAAGKYQMISKTLKWVADEMGLDPDETVFSPANQDKMADWLIKRRLSSATTPEEAVTNLSKEWASFPKPDGQGTYPGQDARVSVDEVFNALPEFETPPVPRKRPDGSVETPAEKDIPGFNLPRGAQTGSFEKGMSLPEGAQVSESPRGVSLPEGAQSGSVSESVLPKGAQTVSETPDSMSLPEGAQTSKTPKQTSLPEGAQTLPASPDGMSLPNEAQLTTPAAFGKPPVQIPSDQAMYFDFTERKKHKAATGAPIDLTEQESAIMQPVVSDVLAQKIDFALDVGSPGRDSINSQLLRGGERSLRNSTAALRDLTLEKQRFDFIREFSKVKGGDPLSQEEVDFVRTLSAAQLTNPDTVLEEMFAEKVIATSMAEDNSLRDVVETVPGVSQAYLDVAHEHIVKQQIVQKRLMESADIGQLIRSPGGALQIAQSVAFSIIPFASNLLVSGDIWDSAEALENYVDYLYNLPSGEFYTEFNSTFDRIRAVSVLDAARFADAVLGYTNSDKFLDNAFNAVDALTLGVGGAIAKGTKSAARVGTAAVRNPADTLRTLKTSLRQTVQSVQRVVPDMVDTLGNIGQVRNAAAETIYQNARRKALSSTADLDKNLANVRRTYSSFMNPENFMGDGFQTSRTVAERIQRKLHLNAAHVLSAFTNRVPMNTLTDEQITRAFDVAATDLRREYNSLNDAIIDVIPVFPDNPISDNLYVTLRLGRPDGTPIPSARGADHWGKQYGLKKNQYTIHQQGSGYYLDLSRTVDETVAMDDVVFSTKNAQPIISMSNGFLDGLKSWRSTADTLSVADQELRRTLVSGIQRMNELMSFVGRDVAKLSKSSRKRMDKFLEAMRGEFSMTDAGQRLPGREFRTLGEFEQEWMTMFDRLPTAKETGAYFAIKQLHQMDALFRNVSKFRYKARRGVRSYRLGGSGAYWDGRRVDTIPSRPAPVIMLDDGGQTFLTPDQLRRMAGTDLEYDDVIQQFRDNGYEFIQVYDVPNAPFEQTAHFVITKRAQSKNLDFNQIPYDPGGYVEHNYNYFVKQGRVTDLPSGTQEFQGSVAVQGTVSRAEANELVENAERAAELYRRVLSGADDAVEEFENFVENNLPWSPRQLREWYEAGELNSEMPFVVTAAGQSVSDTSRYSTILKGVQSWEKSPFNLTKDLEKEFAGLRQWDVYSVRPEDNPLFVFEKPRLLSPVRALNRMAAQTARQAYTTPYKIRAADNFIRDFATGPDAVVKARAGDNPLAVLANPDYISIGDRPDLLPKQRAAKHYREATVQLMGQRTMDQRAMAAFQQNIVDMAYNNLGRESSEWVFDHVVPFTPDPVRFARQVAFHSKLGLFNPVQLFLQAQTFVTTAAISPKAATSAMPASLLMRWLDSRGTLSGGVGTVDTRFVDRFANYASSFGWKEDHFKEAYTLLRDSGMWRVQGEHAFKWDMLDAPIVKSRIGEVIDSSAVFFTEGERFNRISAFNTSYIEWRTANPTKALTSIDKASIIRRADDLSVNMTQASMSTWQRGLASIPTQFFTYQLRLFELLWGKRLGGTTAERNLTRARVLGAYAALYGVPVSVGAATMLPMYEPLKKELIKRGIEYDDGAVRGLLGGIPEMMMSAMGLETNAGQRYGPGGLDVITDIVYGDKPFWEVALGASGSITGDIMRSTRPLMMDVADQFSGHNAVPMMKDDLADLFSNVSSVSQGIKAYVMMTTGKAMRDGEVIVDDINSAEAIFHGIFGTSPPEQTDLYLINTLLTDQHEGQKWARDMYIKRFRKWIKEDDGPQKDAYFRQMRLYLRIGDFRPDQWSGIITEALEGNIEAFGKAEQRLMEQISQSHQVDVQRAIIREREQDNGTP